MTPILKRAAVAVAASSAGVAAQAQTVTGYDTTSIIAKIQELAGTSTGIFLALTITAVTIWISARILSIFSGRGR